MTLALAIPAPDTAEWEAWRDGGIGASELPALLGESPWQTERGLALEKRGLVPHRKETAATRWGHRVEDAVADTYAEMTGRRLELTGTLTNPRWPHLFATPDRRDADDPRHLVEIKWTNRWSEPPRRVRIQCLAQLGIADADVVDVVVAGPYGEPKPHPIERDEAEIVALLDYGEEWFVRFVLGDELPPEDGSETSRKFLDTLAGTGPLRASAEQADLMRRLRAARLGRDAAEKQEAVIRNLLLASMAGYDALEGDGFRAAWSRVKGRTTIGWEHIAQAYRRLLLAEPALIPEQELDTIQSLYTITGEPSRSFRPTWSGAGEGDD